MNKLNSDNIKLLDKVYNLCSNDSVILSSMDKEKNKSIELRDNTSEVRHELQSRISDLTEEEAAIKREGNDLSFVLTSICQNDYSVVLKSLDLDFSPDKLLNELNEKLPSKLEVIGNDIKMANNELGRVEEKLAELVTRIEELNIRKEEALVNQEHLNKYLNLALSNNINATRDEISSLLEKFDFNSEEQKDIAKMLMFPEDGLIDYDKGLINLDTKSSTFDEKEILDKSTDNSVENFKFEDFIIKDNNDFDSKEEEKPAFEIIEPSNDPISSNNEDENGSIVFEPITFSIPELNNDDFHFETENIIETNSLVEDEKVFTKEIIIEKLKELGFDELDFASNDIETIISNYDEKMIEKNVNLAKELKISNDVFFDNVELLFDKELEDKINKLTSVGKLPNDIYLNPDVLTKYTLSELGSAIKVLEDSGLEPKNVPLMAY